MENFPFIEGIGSVFCNINNILKALSIYVSNFKNSMNEVERQEQENPRFAQFLQEQPGDQDLSALLCMFSVDIFN